MKTIHMTPGDTRCPVCRGPGPLSMPEVDPSEEDIAAAGERARIIVWLEGGAAWEALGAGDELGVSGVHPDDVGNILNSIAGLLRRGEQS